MRCERVVLVACLVLFGVALSAGAPSSADRDGDGIADASDNCTRVPNASQVDADADGYGNACDCDFDQNGVCNIDDYNLFQLDFAAGHDSGRGTDMDASGTVNIDDLNLFLPGYARGAPGPAAGMP